MDTHSLADALLAWARANTQRWPSATDSTQRAHTITLRGGHDAPILEEPTFESAHSRMAWTRGSRLALDDLTQWWGHARTLVPYLNTHGTALFVRSLPETAVPVGGVKGGLALDGQSANARSFIWGRSSASITPLPHLLAVLQAFEPGNGMAFVVDGDRVLARSAEDAIALLRTVKTLWGHTPSAWEVPSINNGPIVIQAVADGALAQTKVAAALARAKAIAPPPKDMP